MKKTDKLKKSLGSSLRVARKKLGLTQDEFAKPLGITGGYVSDLERGLAVPSEPVVRQMESVFRINRDFLFSGEGELFLSRAASIQEEVDAFSAEMQENEDGYLDFDEEMELEREKEVAQLLGKASAVLKFKFTHNTQCYSDSLAATIAALYRAIKLEEKFVPKRGIMALRESGRK